MPAPDAIFTLEHSAAELEAAAAKLRAQAAKLRACDFVGELESDAAPHLLTRTGLGVALGVSLSTIDRIDRESALSVRVRGVRRFDLDVVRAALSKAKPQPKRVPREAEVDVSAQVALLGVLDGMLATYPERADSE